MKKGLSIEECKEKDIPCHVYDNGWYEYLLENGFVLCDNKGKIILKDVDRCHVYDNEWYSYDINGKITLCDNNRKIVVKDVDFCTIYDTGWYEYKINGKYTICNPRKEIVIDNVDSCFVNDNHYEYTIEGKRYEKNFDGSTYYGKETSKQDDKINPNHYKQGKIEIIECIENQLSKEGFEGYCSGNIIKYVGRYKFKNGLEDLKKAQWYLNKLIEIVEKE